MLTDDPVNPQTSVEDYVDTKVAPNTGLRAFIPVYVEIYGDAGSTSKDVKAIVDTVGDNKRIKRFRLKAQYSGPTDSTYLIQAWLYAILDDDTSVELLYTSNETTVGPPYAVTFNIRAYEV